MTKDQLLEILKDCAASMDQESAHADADAALVEYVNDSEITEAYNAIAKWYA